MGIYTGLDLKSKSETFLHKHFGKSGRFYYKMVRGIDNRPVTPNRQAKSIGAEDTFENDITNIEKLEGELKIIAQKVAKRLASKNLSGRTLTLKIKFSDFSQITRNHSFNHYISDEDTIEKTSIELLQKVELENQSIRLLGITISNFPVEINLGDEQLKLF